MNENALTRELAKRLRAGLPGAVVFKHDDMRTAGVPDISVTWRGRTVWLEAKRGEEVEGREVQALVMSRLARQGLAYYVLYSSKTTSVLSPVRDGDGAYRVYLHVSQRPRDHKMIVWFVGGVIRKAEHRARA